MNNLFRMDSFQSGEQLRKCVDGVRNRHCATFPAIIECAARHIFQHQKVTHAKVHMLVEGHYMGMKNTRGGARFTLKSLEKAWFMTKIRLNLFNRHQSIKS